MSGTIDYQELRFHKRFGASQGTLAAFLTPARQSLIKLGHIIDISKGGLSMRYIGVEDEEWEVPELLILGKETCHIHLSPLPVRIVYDFELTDESAGLLLVKRCGVEFGDLTSRQEYLLDEFLAGFSQESE